MIFRSPTQVAVGFGILLLILVSRPVVALDSGPYVEVLTRYVHGGNVDYRAFEADRELLDQYVASLASPKADELAQMSREDKIAFWINAYNAITLKLILDNFPLKRVSLSGLPFPENSIRQIPGVWDSQ